MNAGGHSELSTLSHTSTDTYTPHMIKVRNEFINLTQLQGLV